MLEKVKKRGKTEQIIKKQTEWRLTRCLTLSRWRFQWKEHGLFLGVKHFRPSPSVGRKKTVVHAVDMLLKGLAASSSRPCGLMSEFRALDYCQSIDDLVKQGQAHQLIHCQSSRLGQFRLEALLTTIHSELAFPFLCRLYTGAVGLIPFQIATAHSEAYVWNVCTCVFIPAASFKIEELCPVSNKNGFCHMPVHTCVT